jgi:MSHA biogenesis protein MshQ
MSMDWTVRKVILILGLLLGLCSSTAWAQEVPLCSEVWPVGNGLNEYVPSPVLPSFNATTMLVADNPRTVVAGDSYWLGGNSDTSWNLIAPTSGTARVYVRGSLLIRNNARINAYGSPRNLILIVDGDLTIENSNNTLLNALIYATGNVEIGNNPSITGGVSAAGSLSRGNNINYDAGAIAGTDFGSLCNNPDSVGQIDHFRFVHAATGLSCNPLDVTLKACATADCSRLYEGSIITTLSPSTWEGGDQRTFTGGQAFLKLRGVGDVNLGIATVTPTANNPLRCSTTDCMVYFAQSGFIFTVPDLLAGKPQSGIALQAVRSEPGDPQRCVPGFGPATRTVQFWGTHVTPGTGSMALKFNGDAISMNAAAPTSLTLNFDNMATAVLPSLSYADAGQMRLNARYLGTGAEAGLDMRGSDEFVSRPYGFHIATPGQDSSCTAATVEGCDALSVGEQRIAAGDPFDLNIRAVAWQSDEEPRTAITLADNPTTPNFQLNGMRLDSLQALPAAGAFEYLDPAGAWAPLASYDHAAGSMTLKVRQREVGIFQVSAAPLVYFGESIGGGESALLGRFTPAWLGVTSTASLTPACGAFSYQGQLVAFADGKPTLRITGYNRRSQVTQNYDLGNFWRLAAPQREAYVLNGPAGLVARLQEFGDQQSLPAVTDDVSGDGSRLFEWREEGVRQADALSWSMPVSASEADLPLDLSASGGLLQLRVVQAQLTDLDDVCYRGSTGQAGSCEDFVQAFGGIELRLGRLRIEDGSAVVTQQLDLPYWLEYLSGWNPAASGQAQELWVKSADDSCSPPRLGDVQLEPDSFTGNLAATDFPTPSGSLIPSLPEATQPSGLIRLPAPNKQGSVLVSLSGLQAEPPALPWLMYNWKDHSRTGDGLKAPMGKATFGPQSTQRALIFRRELYR